MTAPHQYSARDIVAGCRAALARASWRWPALALTGSLVYFRTARELSGALIDDRGVCYVHPEQYARLAQDPQHLEFVVAHEVLHFALAHHLRIGARDAWRWNRAADRWINSALVQAGVGGGAATAEKLRALLPAPADLPQWTWVEDLYEREPLAALGPSVGRLLRGCAVAAADLAGTLSGEGEGDPDYGRGTVPSTPVEARKRLETAEAVDAALEACRPLGGASSVPGALAQTFLRRWSAVLGAGAPLTPNDVRFGAYSRRRADPAVLSPGPARPRMLRHAIVLDSSASIPDAAMRLAVRIAVDEMMRARGAPIYLVVHDHEVQWAGWVESRDRAGGWKRFRRGGTKFGPAYAAVAAAGARFTHLLHVTDGAPADAWPARPANVGLCVAALTAKGATPPPDDYYAVDLTGGAA